MIGNEIFARPDFSVWSYPLGVPHCPDGDKGFPDLSDEEMVRARRFRRASDRARYEGAHAALRSRLAEFTGRGRRDLVFRRGPWGKPELSDPGDCWFNLSYRDDVALIATSISREVGVDVDSLQDLIDIDGTALEIMSAHERLSWSRFPETERLPSLLRCWTRKEAVLKALGIGLSLDPRGFSVGFGCGCTRLSVTVDEREVALEVFSFKVRPRYMGAVALVIGPR